MDLGRQAIVHQDLLEELQLFLDQEYRFQQVVAVAVEAGATQVQLQLQAMEDLAAAAEAVLVQTTLAKVYRDRDSMLGLATKILLQIWVLLLLAAEAVVQHLSGRMLRVIREEMEGRHLQAQLLGYLNLTHPEEEVA